MIVNKMFVAMLCLISFGCMMRDTPKDSTVVASKALIDDSECEFKFHESGAGDDIWLRAPCDYGLNVGKRHFQLRKKNV